MNKFESKINPKLVDFLEKNKDITLASLAWSLCWRLYVLLLSIGFIIGFLSALIDAL